MAEDIEPQAEVEVEAEVEEETLEPVSEKTDWEQRAKKLEEKAIAQRERTRMLKAEIEKLKKATTPKPETPAKADAGELDETQLDYLDLKGINETEDIEVIQAVMKRTGQTVRQALKDEYVQTKLKANADKRAVANAMPSNTKRGSNGAGMGLEAAIAKYEQTGEYPADFELRAQVVNAMVDKASTSVPPWRK